MLRTTVVIAMAVLLLGLVGVAVTSWAGTQTRTEYYQSCGSANAAPPSSGCAAMDADLHAWEALGYLSVVALVLGLMSTLVQTVPRHPRPGWTHWYGARGKRWT